MNILNNGHTTYECQLVLLPCTVRKQFKKRSVINHFVRDSRNCIDDMTITSVWEYNRYLGFLVPPPGDSQGKLFENGDNGDNP